MTDPMLLPLLAILAAVSFSALLLWLAEWSPRRDDEIPPPEQAVDATRWRR